MGKRKITRLQIWCCNCNTNVKARLTNGKEVYNHIPNLHLLPFWICDSCKGTVGCHHKTRTPTKPLGCIPSPEIKNARKEIHKILDPLWEQKIIHRNDLYRLLSNYLGYTYHTAEIKDIEEARKIWRFIKSLYKNKKGL